MRILGVDFTSRPTRRKPITVAVCELTDACLRFSRLGNLTDFAAFESQLSLVGPWAAAMDFPFGQSARFLDNIGWPYDWPDYVEHVSRMDRRAFRKCLDDYRQPRPAGDKEHQRASDQLTGAISPQKLYGVPVGLMFFAGAKRLLKSGVTIAGLYAGDKQRVVFEAYPGVLARRATPSGYKSDDRAKQTAAHQKARDAILDFVLNGGVTRDYGLTVDVPSAHASRMRADPTGDELDALLCAVQATWAWRAWPRLKNHISDIQRREGWIADPMIFPALH
ncbi:MAG: DUF429 domain-containing protein [Pseudomonadota bacterium]